MRHRLNRGGNRRLNAILYRIAITQAGASAQAKAYLARRAADGKSRREALRALKRHLVRAVWRLWQECRPVSAEAAARASAGGRLTRHDPGSPAGQRSRTFPSLVSDVSRGAPLTSSSKRTYG